MSHESRVMSHSYTSHVSLHGTGWIREWVCTAQYPRTPSPAHHNTPSLCTPPSPSLYTPLRPPPTPQPPLPCQILCSLRSWVARRPRRRWDNQTHRHTRARRRERWNRLRIVWRMKCAFCSVCCRCCTCVVAACCMCAAVMQFVACVLQCGAMWCRLCGGWSARSAVSAAGVAYVECVFHVCCTCAAVCCSIL